MIASLTQLHADELLDGAFSQSDDIEVPAFWSDVLRECPENGQDAQPEHRLPTRAAGREAGTGAAWKRGRVKMGGIDPGAVP
jgi:hypothetical protein